VTDQTDPVPPKPRRRRTTRFVLPDHHHDELADERSAEHIEAFIEGLGATTERKTTGRARSRRRRDTRDRRYLEFDSGDDWEAAVRQEAARSARYGRPTSVLLVEPRDDHAIRSDERTANHIREAIRVEARATDRAARVGPMHYRVLLPETDGHAADVVASRLGRAIASSRDPGYPIADVRIDVVTSSPSGSITDSLAAAERRRAIAAPWEG
jgi:hypothetical protein